MNCEHARESIEAYLDATVADPEAGALESHLAACSGCRTHLQELQTLKRRLSLLTVPTPRPGRLESIVQNAVQSSAQKVPRGRIAWRLHVTLAAAAAVLLAVGIAIGARWTDQTIAASSAAAPVIVVAQAVQLGAETQRIGLLFNSSEAIRDASISLSLPEGVEIAGRSAVHHLQWHTDLKPGTNRLILSLVATGSQGGTLVAEVSKGSLITVLKVPIVIATLEDGRKST